MKRVICLICAVLMLLPMLFACKKKEEDEKPANTVTTQSDVDESPNDHDDLPDDLDFQGRSVKIFYGVYDPNFDCQAWELEGTLSNSDVVASSVYTRNLNVKSRLNVSLDFVSYGNVLVLKDYIKHIENEIALSGSSEYDLVYHRASDSVAQANKGYFRNISDLPYANWEKSYWFNNQMESISLNKSGKYVLLGDLLVSNYANMTAMFFNRDLYENQFQGKKSDEIYDMVRNNEWTWENYFKIVAEVHEDTGSDNVAENIYGAHWENGTRTCFYYPFTSGLRFTTRNDEGFPVLNFNNQRNGAMVEDLYDFINTNPGAAMMSYDEAAASFLGGRMMFYSYFLSRGTDISANAQFRYGILPFPKYDESTDYTSIILTGAGVFTIPLSVDGDSRMECLGATLEAMCSESKKLIVPSYYETVLKIKQATALEDREMIGMIRDHLNFDVSFWMSSSMGGVASVFQKTILTNKTNSLSRTWRELGSGYESKLATLIDNYKKTNS